MTAKAFAAIAAATAIAALLLPGIATAAPRHPTAGHNPTVVASFRVPGSHGYTLTATLRNRSALTVSAVVVEHPSIVAASYKLRVRRSPGSDRIEASLGKLGRIEMRFVPESSYEEEPLFPICQGEKEAIEEGQYVGLFEFHGEHGFTRTRVRRAPGWVSVAPAPTCHHRPVGHGPHQRGPRQREGFAGDGLGLLAKAKEAAQVEAHGLLLKAETKSPPVQFEASRVSGPDKKGKEFTFDTFFAGAARDLGRIKEESAVLDLFVRGPYFKVPDLARPTSEVLVAPPAPYLGSATLRRGSTQKVGWSGDLRVGLPGFGVVPLAGPGAQASICADAGCPSTK